MNIEKRNQVVALNRSNDINGEQKEEHNENNHENKLKKNDEIENILDKNNYDDKKDKSLKNVNLNGCDECHNGLENIDDKEIVLVNYEKNGMHDNLIDNKMQNKKKIILSNTRLNI